MSGPKDNDNTKSFTNTNEKTDNWEFDKLTTTKAETTAKAELHKREKIVTRQKDKLTLDEAAVPRTKTRSAMAIEMQGVSDKEDEDIYTYAPVPKRGIALIIDLAFTAGLLHGSKLASPYARKLIQFFLDKYKLQLLIPESLVMPTILGVICFLSLFFFIVIPVAFFNHSLGKKLMGLKVRGDEKYTISISQAFSRELIFKPLSLLIIAGFITPFFSKQKKSVHDMLGHTLVIED